jgi:hypothetical protein
MTVYHSHRPFARAEDTRRCCACDAPPPARGPCPPRDAMWPDPHCAAGGGLKPAAIPVHVSGRAYRSGARGAAYSGEGVPGTCESRSQLSLARGLGSARHPGCRSGRHCSPESSSRRYDPGLAGTEGAVCTPGYRMSPLRGWFSRLEKGALHRAARCEQQPGCQATRPRAKEYPERRDKQVPGSRTRAPEWHPPRALPNGTSHPHPC